MLVAYRTGAANATMWGMPKLVDGWALRRPFREPDGLDVDVEMWGDILGLPISLPTTTGAPRPLTGGEIQRPRRQAR
jgi:hypothetical protein